VYSNTNLWTRLGIAGDPIERELGIGVLALLVPHADELAGDRGVLDMTARVAEAEPARATDYEVWTAHAAVLDDLDARAWVGAPAEARAEVDKGAGDGGAPPCKVFLCGDLGKVLFAHEQLAAALHATHNQRAFVQPRVDMVSPAAHTERPVLALERVPRSRHCVADAALLCLPLRLVCRCSSTSTTTAICCWQPSLKVISLRVCNDVCSACVCAHSFESKSALLERKRANRGGRESVCVLTLPEDCLETFVVPLEVDEKELCGRGRDGEKACDAGGDFA